MKYLVNIVEKAVQKDGLGRVMDNKAAFVVKRQIRTDFFMQYNQELARKAYGFDNKTTHKTITFDEVNLNEFVQHEGDIFKIVKVINNPRNSVLLLELMHNAS